MKRAMVLTGLIGIVGVVGAAVLWWWGRVTYDPPFDPKNFSPVVNHKYFTLKPGTTFRYDKKTSSGMMRVEAEMIGETRQVMGITTAVVREREWVNDQLVEDTYDWYAQDKDGNVWYFGETVSNYKDGKLTDQSGSWEAGPAGARPGIIMPAAPRVGQTYRQESAKGIAEDMGTVVAVGEKVAVPHGTYDDCVKIRDWSRLEWGGDYKYFCAGIGFMALAEESSERLELVTVSGK
jgi:hypothetical protein